MADFSQILSYIPGAVIFLVASGQVRESRRLIRSDLSRNAEVKSAKRVTKNDKYGRVVYDYYEITAESENPSTGKKERHTVKSPVGYEPKQKVTMYFDKVSGEALLGEEIREYLFHPWAGMLFGALLILMALFQNQGKEVLAMTCLALLLTGAGLCMILNYVSLKKKNLETVSAEIVEIYERQISKPGRFSGSGRFTYYPIVRYEKDGVSTLRRCNVNSSRKESFRIGDNVKLYYSPSEDGIREKHANPIILAAGILCVACGILAGLSILSVIA